MVYFKVQLSDALLKTKEKQQVNKNEVRINDKSIPLIKESRGWQIQIDFTIKRLNRNGFLFKVLEEMVF